MSRRLRQSIRLHGYDYGQDGAYFVTICSAGRALDFGDIADGEMTLSTLGCIVDACWWAITEHFPGVELDAFVVMPNHIHGIVIINRWDSMRHTSPEHVVEATHASPLPRPKGPKPGSLAAIIGSYKSAVTRQLNQLRRTPGQAVWQRNYYEHIIRSESALNRIRQYIHANPDLWLADDYFRSE